MAAGHGLLSLTVVLYLLGLTGTVRYWSSQ